MKIFVNDKEIYLLPGMKAIHAVIGAGLMDQIESGRRVYDEWGNEIGLNGEFVSDTKIFVR
ncbi:MAG TPA: hypothetical protein VMT62_06430 [Syntrophorhabdaceae bacterium]|nr:hypothetical protein [Syntrophorhabdaceae bacterium]